MEKRGDLIIFKKCIKVKLKLWNHEKRISIIDVYQSFSAAHFIQHFYIN